MSVEDRQLELLEELVAWTRFANRETLIGVWKGVLADQRHLRAYEFSDGTRSQKEVGDISGLSQPAISGLWQKWRRLGIARDHAGRVSHIARPSDFGVTIPASESPSTRNTVKKDGEAAEVAAEESER